MLGREVAVRVLTVAGGLTIAALLGPAAYGVFAVGLTLLPTLLALSVGGLSASLMRRPDPPTQIELRALFTFQLGFSLIVALIGLAVSFVVLPAVGADARDARAICLALVALPISAFRAGASTLLERDLQYERLSVVDVSEQAALYGVAVLLAALGAGIWSLAPACVAGSFVATFAALRLTKLSPRLTKELGSLRAIWRFGAGFQLNYFLQGIRDFGLNALLLAFAGAATAGIWALAQRLLAPAIVMLEVLTRISFVAFSKVLGRGESERHAQMVLGMVAVAVAALFACVVGAVPALVHGVIGDSWAGVVRPVTLAACGWMVIIPIAASVGGLVQARGDLRAPTLGIISQVTILWAAATLFAPTHGAIAVGVAWLIGMMLNACLFVLLSRRFVTLDLRPVAAGLVVGVGAAAAGRVVADALPTVAGLVLSTGTALACWLALSVWLARTDLRRLASFAGLSTFVTRT
jgi:PST family polysaccharide transporter